MKNVLFWSLSLILVGMLISCDKEIINDDSALIEEISSSSSKQALALSELSITVNDFVSEYYFETYIDEAWKVPELGTELELGNGSFLYFDKTERPLFKGTKKDCDGIKGFRDKPGFHKPGRGCDEIAIIPIEEVPEDIIAYMATNYPDIEIKVVKGFEDKYVVALEDHTLVVFDGEGVFVEESSFVGGNGGHCGGPGENIDFEELPASVVDYIATNYPDAEFKGAKLKGNVKYIIGLRFGEEKAVLFFDLGGNFLGSHS